MDEKFEFWVVYLNNQDAVIEPDMTRDEMNQKILQKIRDGYNPRIIATIRLSSIKTNKSEANYLPETEVLV
jgi:hypothetical protein